MTQPAASGMSQRCPRVISISKLKSLQNSFSLMGDMGVQITIYEFHIHSNAHSFHKKVKTIYTLGPLLSTFTFHAEGMSFCFFSYENKMKSIVSLKFWMQVVSWRVEILFQ